MTHVRTILSEVLHITKMLSSGSAAHKSTGVAAGPIQKPTERNDQSPWFSKEIPDSPVSGKVLV